MAPKRRATVDSDSEDDLLQHSSPAAKRPRTSQPNATQAEAPILDAENEAKFEKDHEGAVMEQILGKKLGAAAVGVRRTSSRQNPRHSQTTGNRRDGYHRICRDDQLHVSPISHLQVWPSGQLHHRPQRK